MAELPRTADIAVVGGGVVGASVLYHLAKAGCTDTVLIERETLGAGSTSKAAGGIRAQFSDELNIRIAVEAISRFERFGDEPGADIDYKQWGYLFLLGEDHLESWNDSLSLQNRLGVPSRLIDLDEVLSIVPQLSLEGIAAASFCPLDGYATPEAVALGYAQAASRLGASIVQGCNVIGIDVDHGRVQGVQTTRGEVLAGTVICVAGVWTTELTATAGLELPVTPEKRYVFLTDPDPLPHELPLTIDFETSFYFQRERDGLLFGGRVATLEDLAPAATHRLPILNELGIKPGWWGYYAMSPDHNAIVGRAREPEGLLYATGFSGHGFQQSPVVGEYLSDLAVGREPVLDLSPLSVDRFATGEVKPEANVV
jgi:sarcosine oxidase subunit beta